MNERYRVIEESTTGHCCFSFTVEDTGVIDCWGEYRHICETFERTEAELICRVLNAYRGY